MIRRGTLLRALGSAALFAGLLAPTAAAEDSPGENEPRWGVSLPAADPNAPEIDLEEINPPVEAADSFGSSLPAAQDNCGPRDEGGTRVCVGFGEGSVPAETLQERFAADPSLVDWCDGEPLRNRYNRYEACLKGWSPLIVTVDVNGQLIGTAEWAMQQEIRLQERTPTVEQSIWLVPISIDAALVSVTLNWTESDSCGNRCTRGSQQWDGSLTWRAGDLHSARGAVDMEWTQGSGEWDFNVGWNMQATSPMAPGVANFDWSFIDSEINCDALVGRYQGCTFEEYIPTFAVNTVSYPAAAGFYWVMKEGNANHPGSVRHDSPLHRLASESEQQKNRNTICPSSYIRHPETPDSSCDEYAFAASRESGGSVVQSGDECAQFVTREVSGRWTITADTRYPAITWTEECGRASVPGPQNSGVGGDLGIFVQRFRVLDADPYWVNIPLLDEQCDSVDEWCEIEP